MADDSFRVLELLLQGFNCSQIMAKMALDSQGKEDPALVRAMTGLVGGMGCGRTCGCLTGGCATLGLFAGRGAEDEVDDDRLPAMLATFVDWFESRYGSRHGGTDCDVLTEKDPALRLSRCPTIIGESYAKVTEILAAHGFLNEDEAPP